MLKEKPLVPTKATFHREIQLPGQPRRPRGLIIECSHLIVCDLPNLLGICLEAWKSCQKLL